MLGKLTSAITRAFLVALVIAMPALIIPSANADGYQFAFICGIFGAALVFVEYFATYPSIIEFRNAPPFNRIRFFSIMFCVFVLSCVASNQIAPNALNGLLTSVATIIGRMTDFPYSPVRLILLVLPASSSAETTDAVRIAAGLCYTISLISLLIFFFVVRVLDWPARNGAFNVWVNLPLFDPTTGGDVLPRLIRDGRLNIVAGALLPFLFPALLELSGTVISDRLTQNPQSLIWTMVIWSFFPATMVMRGIAMLRVAGMIDEHRKRAYAAAQGLQPV